MNEHASPYHTAPLGQWGSLPNRSRWRELRDAGRSFLNDLLYVVTPRVATPVLPTDPPVSAAAGAQTQIDEKTLQRCQEIFDRVEATREGLDEKARSTFAVTSFLAPLLIGGFSFVISNAQSGSVTYAVAVGLCAVAFALLMLGFVATARALAAQRRENLFLDSVIDTANGAMRAYSESDHAGGLLYCASVNASYNGHISSCVRAAHVLTSGAVIVGFLAAIPLIMVMSQHQPDPTKVSLNAPVSVEVRGLEALQTDLAAVSQQLGSQPDWNKSLSAISERIGALEAHITSIQSATCRSTTPSATGAN